MGAIDKSKVKFTQRAIIFLLFLQIFFFFFTNETQMSIEIYDMNHRTHMEIKKSKSQHKQ